MISAHTLHRSLGLGPWTPAVQIAAVLRAIPATQTNPVTHALTPAQRVAIHEAACRLEEWGTQYDMQPDELEHFFKLLTEPEPT